jgi:hypothetical protein
MSQFLSRVFWSHPPPPGEEFDGCLLVGEVDNMGVNRVMTGSLKGDENYTRNEWRICENYTLNE